MTYVKAPSNEPLGLDMSQFNIQKENSGNANRDTDDLSQLEQEIINGCMERHGTFNSVLQKRSANLKVI